jgi:hypothetical protein
MTRVVSKHQAISPAALAVGIALGTVAQARAQVPAPDFVIDIPTLTPATPGFGYQVQGPPNMPFVTYFTWDQNPLATPPVEIIVPPPIFQPVLPTGFIGHGTILLAPGNPWGVPAGGPVPVNVQGTFVGTCRTYDAGSPKRALFDTEMLQLDLVGSALPNPILIRESPTRVSVGETRVEDLGGGRWMVSSFFDTFFELSFDAGQTWTPASTTPTRIEMFPAPGGLALLGPGCAMLGRRVRPGRWPRFRAVPFRPCLHSR